MAQASLLACEGLSGVCLVPTVASKKMMPKQSSKQTENGERGNSPNMLGLRQESEKSRSRKEAEPAEASQPKKTIKKVMVIEQNGSFQLRIPKNFICEHCYGAFRSSYHLKRHILIHTAPSALPQGRSPSSAICVTCASSRSTTWSATSACTAARSPTNASAACRASPGQIGCLDTNECARAARPKPLTHSCCFRSQDDALEKLGSGQDFQFSVSGFACSCSPGLGGAELRTLLDSQMGSGHCK
ncbi:zinc finger protein 740 isoform X1 [Eretmochelys imbricata]